MLHALGVHTDQATIVSALESGKATGDVGPLKRIDTHMSHLFLGEARVLQTEAKPSPSLRGHVDGGFPAAVV